MKKLVANPRGLLSIFDGVWRYEKVIKRTLKHEIDVSKRFEGPGAFLCVIGVSGSEIRFLHIAPGKRGQKYVLACQGIDLTATHLVVYNDVHRFYFVKEKARSEV